MLSAEGSARFAACQVTGEHFVRLATGFCHLRLATSTPLRYGTSCPLQPADFRSLLAGQNLGQDAIDAYLVGDGLGSTRVAEPTKTA